MADPIPGSVTDGRRTAALYAIPLCLAALAALFPIDGAFVFDDHRAIAGNPFVTGAEPFWRSIFYDFWGIPISGRITTWRPLVPVIWKALWGILPGNPLPFRIMTLLLHVAATAAMLWLFRRYLKDDILLAAASIFALHPIHSEAIGGMVSHVDILAAFTAMLAILIALRNKGYAGIVISFSLVALTCFIKEISIIYGITLILLWMIQDIDIRCERRSENV